jgi:hypothetical protein
MSYGRRRRARSAASIIKQSELVGRVRFRHPFLRAGGRLASLGRDINSEKGQT